MRLQKRKKTEQTDCLQFLFLTQKQSRVAMDAVDAAALMPLVGIYMNVAYPVKVGHYFFMQHTQNLAVHKHSMCMLLLEKLLN